MCYLRKSRHVYAMPMASIGIMTDVILRVLSLRTGVGTIFGIDKKRDHFVFVAWGVLWC